ncbi:MAG: ABC transporter permease [Bacteroidales bacterium]
MKLLLVFGKSLREQVREFWILVMVVLMAPLFIGIYYLMVESEGEFSRVAVVNLRGESVASPDPGWDRVLADSLQESARLSGGMFRMLEADSREAGMALLREDRADVCIVLPANLDPVLRQAATGSPSFGEGATVTDRARLEILGDLANPAYIVGAVWAEEIATGVFFRAMGVSLPVEWTETPLGSSGSLDSFERYVPGLLILSVIMILFSASAALVREVEAGTMERLKISRLTTLDFLGGLSLLQLLLAVVSVGFALLTAMTLGYTLEPGRLGFLSGLVFLTALSMVGFSLLVGAMCRSVKEVAILGTFPLFLLMFFTGAAFPLGGQTLFHLGDYPVRFNHLLSPTFAVEALEAVLVRGKPAADCLPQVVGLLATSTVYFLAGGWAFQRRHMRARS